MSRSKLFTRAVMHLVVEEVKNVWFQTYFKMLVGQFEVLFINVVPLLRRRSSDFLTRPSYQPSFKKIDLDLKTKAHFFCRVMTAFFVKLCPNSSLKNVRK